MFGHNDNQDDQNNSQQNDSNDSLGAMPPVVPDPSVTAGLNDSPAFSANNDSGSSDAPSAPSVPPGPTGPSLVEPTTTDEPAPQEESVSNNTAENQVSENENTTEESTSESSGESTNEPPSDTPEEAPTTDSSAPADSELMDLKQQALQQLSPLVGHLEQTPEEKFRTTMMMIQASDDSTLVKTAFEAAQAISDDKARAQALLDVINEINYFTQHKAE